MVLFLRDGLAERGVRTAQGYGFAAACVRSSSRLSGGSGSDRISLPGGGVYRNQVISTLPSSRWTVPLRIFPACQPWNSPVRVITSVERSISDSEAKTPV